MPLRIVQIFAVIPEPSNVRDQGNLLNLLADIDEGKRPLADVFPQLRQVEFKAVFQRRRMDKADYDKLMAPPVQAEPPKEAPKEEPKNDEGQGGEA